LQRHAGRAGLGPTVRVPVWVWVLTGFGRRTVFALPVWCPPMLEEGNGFLQLLGWLASSPNSSPSLPTWRRSAGSPAELLDGAVHLVGPEACSVLEALISCTSLEVFWMLGTICSSSLPTVRQWRRCCATTR
jgi:hypothetical protein